jgi:hypothetical protein
VVAFSRYDCGLYVMLYMDSWDGKKMAIPFEPVHVFQCPFYFSISLIHIWHHFSFGMFSFLGQDG